MKEVAEAKSKYNKADLQEVIENKQKEMEAAAKKLDFITAARLRDEIAALNA